MRRRPVQRGSRFKSAVLKPPHLNAVHHHVNKGNNQVLEEKGSKEEREEREDVLRRHEQQGGVQHLFKECHRAFHVPQSGEKHHHHQKRKEKDMKGYQYQHGRYGRQIQYGQVQDQGSAVSESCKKGGKKSDNDESYDNDNDKEGRYDSAVHDVMTEMSRDACMDVEGNDRGKGKKDYKRVRQSFPPYVLDAYTDHHD